MIVRCLAFAFAGLSALLLAFFSGYLLYPLLHTGNGDPFAGTPPLPDADRVDMATFWQVWNLLEQDFYGERPSEQQRATCTTGTRRCRERKKDFMNASLVRFGWPKIACEQILVYELGKHIKAVNRKQSAILSICLQFYRRGRGN